MYKDINHGDNMQLTIVSTLILVLFGRIFFNCYSSETRLNCWLDTNQSKRRCDVLNRMRAFVIVQGWV